MGFLERRIVNKVGAQFPAIGLAVVWLIMGCGASKDHL
jgi:hypothetical protein